MLYIIHGEDVVKSRELILEKTKNLNAINYKEIIFEDYTLNDIYNFLNTDSLFSSKNALVIDITNSKINSNHLDLFKNKSSNTTLILYSSKKIASSSILIKNINLIKAKQIDNNKQHPENMFNFVQALYLKNRLATYKEYEKLINAQTDEYYIFSMILWGLRNVSKCIFDAKSFKDSSEYSKSKTLIQAKLFNEIKILDIYKEFYTIEKQLKTTDLDIKIAIFRSIEIVLN